MAVRIDIVRLQEDGKEIVRFARSPSQTLKNEPVQVPVASRVFWCNLDSKERHHISLFMHALERHVSDPPGPDTSDHVVVTQRIDYSCLLHPDETGAIVVEGTS